MGGTLRTKREKRAEEGKACFPQPLRVPLNSPDGKGAVEHSLDDSIVTPLDGEQIRAGTVHRLMVGAVEKSGFSGKKLKEGGNCLDGMEPVSAIHLAVSGNILGQRAAKINIEQLHPPADAKDGLPGGKKAVNQFQLCVIPLRLQISRSGILLPVPPGLNVPAAGEQQRAAILRGVCGDRGACAVHCAVIVGKTLGITREINAIHSALLAVRSPYFMENEGRRFPLANREILWHNI